MNDEHMSVVDEIAAERQRQIDVEGWGAKHDDKHLQGELALAASSYAYAAAAPDRERDRLLRGRPVPPQWPWAAHWWKPKDRRRDLIRAAALLVAEIERLDRAS